MLLTPRRRQIESRTLLKKHDKTIIAVATASLYRAQGPWQVDNANTAFKNVTAVVASGPISTTIISIVMRRGCLITLVICAVFCTPRRHRER